MGATIFHEYTRFGDFKFNGGQYPKDKEEGNDFEEAVFGKVVDIDNCEIIYKKQKNEHIKIVVVFRAFFT